MERDDGNGGKYMLKILDDFVEPFVQFLNIANLKVVA